MRIDTVSNFGDFYPRSPCGERRGGHIIKTRTKNFYPRSPGGERRFHYDNYNLHCVISIHALLAESDNRYGRPVDVQLVFLSTLSLRRATRAYQRYFAADEDFYPRSPCGERRNPEPGRNLGSNFYPRSPCGERLKNAITAAPQQEFLSTLSLRRATCYSLRHSAQGRHFYPRSPCGERPCITIITICTA